MKQTKSTPVAYMKELLCVGLLFLLSIPAFRSLFHPGLFPTIDNVSVIRIEEMAKELRAGQFPVRMTYELARNRGYMLFNFYGPLPFYTAASIHIAGVNLVGALKRTFLIGLLIGLTGMYGLSRRVFGRFGGMVSALLFLYAPFVGYDVYWRGGIGQVWATMMTPWVLWSLVEIIVYRRKPFRIIGALGLAGMVTSHNLTTYLMVPVFGVWTIVLYLRSRQSLWSTIVMYGSGFFLSAFYWVPAFIEKNNIWVTYMQGDVNWLVGGLARFSWEMIVPPSAPMLMNGAYLVFPFLALAIWVQKNHSGPIRTITAVSFALCVFLYLGTTVAATFFWRALYEQLYMFQFPWRIFTAFTVLSSFLAGMLALFAPSWKARIGVVILVIAVIAWAFPNFVPLRYEFVDKYRAEDPCGTTWGFEYLPTWVRTCLKHPPDPEVEIIQGKGNADMTMIARNHMRITVSDTVDVLRVQRYAYPGWKAVAGGNEVPIGHADPYGLLEISLPQNTHMVDLYFVDTPVRMVGNTLSVFGALSIVGQSIVLVYAQKKRKEHVVV